MSRVRMVGPAASVHTRLWVDAFRRAGHSVDIVSVGRPAPVGLLRVLLSGIRGRLGRTGRPDVSVVHSLGTHGVAGLLLRRGRRNVVVPWGSEVVLATRSRWRHALAARALRRADLVLVTSRSMATTVVREWEVPPGKVAVVSWGVDSSFLSDDDASRTAALGARERHGIAADDLLVLAPRGTGPVYRTAQVEAAFAAARRSRRDLRLVVLGAAATTEAADGLGATGGATRLPYLPKSELADLLRAADAVVSVPAADQRATTVLEAAACGAQLVLSDIEPYRELRDLGLVVHLLPEPLERSLESAFVGLQRQPDDVSARNRDLIRTHEDQEVQMSRVVELCLGRA